MEIITQSHISERHAQGPNFPMAESADGLYSWHHGSPGYVSISCALTGLSDNTAGRIGRRVIYLQYPDADVPAELVAGARAFAKAVRDLKAERERTEDEAATAAALAAPPAPRFPYRSSEEAWDAEDEATWAEMRRHGL